MVDENQEQESKATNQPTGQSEPAEQKQADKPTLRERALVFTNKAKNFFSKDNPLFGSANPKEFLSNLRNRPRLYFSVLGGTGIVVLIAIGALIASFIAHEEHYQEKMSQSTQQQLGKLAQMEKSEGSILENLPTLRDKNSSIPLSNEEQINALIQKADILYAQGQTDEALQIFGDISHTSSSIANHNLGVIKLRKYDYTGALRAFDNALAAKNDMSVNAIDAMVAAFYLNNFDLYTRYLKIAEENIQELEKQPIYSYVYALTLYYGGHYFETLSTLTNPNSKLFDADRQHLAAKMYLLFGDENNAIEHLSVAATPKDDKALGLLYARRGDYKQAIDHLQSYNELYPEDKDTLVALELIALKIGDFDGVHDILSVLLHDIHKNKHREKILTDTYPIETLPNGHFFDINTIRKGFWSTNFRDGIGLPIDRVLFYYAPYKLVDIKDALGSIQEGVFFVDSSGSQDLMGALDSLERGKKGSLADQHMLAGLKHLSQAHLRLALKEFKLSLKANPNSSIAHYDTGLIYAQLENFHEASFHFKKAYHLNTYNVLAGIFGVITTRLDYRDPSHLLKQLTSDFQTLQFNNPVKRAFLNSFIAYLNGASNDDLSWMQKVKQPLSIYYALGVAYANRAQDKTRLVENFATLKKMHPYNMLTAVFYEMMLRYHADIRQMLGAYALLTNKKTNLEELIHGPLLARKMYIYMGFITGLLNHEEEELNARLSASNNQEMSTDLLRMLGLIHIFQKQYEKSVGIYNFLIDKIGDHEMEVYELASVAYIGLGRYDNAALLLEIGKTMDPGNYDVRYGLGLLYQQTGNLEASLNNFGAIKTRNFQSSYFDFRLKEPTNKQDLR
ncbi:Anaphase-promoting protein [Helicobacter sp. NHP19-003]|uniref:Anaphase-promoting protein n=1 Tax=Helicobacter gastrocanis TaxID=2849641 RepID=A0ABM7SB04_9HELI|nr:tetratricopeptide repeat protein [Helicobacter sp. NHP19-003]BCZ17788.1 Anaphase-promoting protein [Helicobacter sp. NHP19-003]